MHMAAGLERNALENFSSDFRSAFSISLLVGDIREPDDDAAARIGYDGDCIPPVSGFGVVFQRDGNAFVYGPVAGIFERDSAACRAQLFEPFAEEFGPSLAENWFDRPIGERTMTLAVEANICFLYGVEDDQGLFHTHGLQHITTPASTSSEIRRGTQECVRHDRSCQLLFA